MEASGDSRIPTARRSGLPRPAPPQLRVGAPFSLAGGSGPFSLSPAAPPEDPPDALPPPKLARFSTGDLPECAPRRCIAPPRPVSSGGRLGSISSGEARAWGAGPSTAHDSPFSRQLARVTHAARRHDYHDDDDYPQDDEDDDDDYPDYPAPPPRCLPPGHPLAHPRLHHAVPPVPRLREASRPWEPAAGESACRVTREGVGRRVVVGGVEGGTLRYVGRTAFAAGEWAGVELDRPAGKNDGSVDGVIYFSCRARHGIFAPVTRVALAPPEPAAPRPGPVPAAVPGPGPGLAATATSGSLPRRPSDSSPEGAECPGAARAMRRVEEGEEGCAGSPGSPGDATCDDSSLGILTPDQMPDFTVTASASLGRSPSDEDVAALEDEVCEAAGGAPAVATAVGVVGAVGGAAASGVASGEPLPRWDSDPSVAALDEELFRSDVSAIIRELRSSAEATAAASTSSGGSSPSRPRPSPDTERFQQDEARLQREHDDDRRDDRRDDDDPRPHGDDDQRSAAPDPVPFSGTVPRSPACPAAQGPREAVGCADLARLPAAARRATPYTTRLLLAAAGPGEVTPETEAAWAGGVGVVSVAGGVGVVVGGAAMTTSAGSLDQGYQGDAECDPRSEGGTGTASSPTEDVRLFQGVMDDVSLGEDDHEADHPVGGALRGGGGGLGVGGGGDRSARIIDGKLYHAPRELARPHDPSASEMDSSGFYSDLDPRDRDAEDESARTDLEPVQEALGGAGAAMHDSLLEDDSRGGGASLHDSLLDDDTRADHSLDDDRSSASTLRPESKDPTLSEAPDPASDGSAPPGTTTLPDPAPGAAPAPPGTTILPDATTILPDTVITAPAAILPAPDTAATTITAAPCTEVDSQATPTPPLEQVGAEEEEAARARARTYDKPWLARPPPPRRKEEPRRPLPPPPPMPKRNVQSRLKALLEAPREAPPEEARRPRQPRKNRWDEVMTKIAEGQREAPRGPPREVKSRLMEGVLAPPAALSPQAERIRQERRERRERRQAQQAAQAAAAAAAAARRPALLRGDRKRSSTTSIRSNRTSRAPSLDSLPADYACSGGAYSRGSSADRSETSHKSSSTASGGGGSRASRDSRVISSSSTAPPLRLSTSSSSTAVDKKLRPDPPFHPPSAAPPGPPPRRPRLEIKTTIPKTGRHPQRKTG
ncbi:uncharacterized protein LOC126991105, partial [Eriocheir sinensis]|uniref:uncharacterized protein LOC126991105 n=1 Tax=Eriocheir sinensis TaxID=95602 RepID=UPI0021C6968A